MLSSVLNIIIVIFKRFFINYNEFLNHFNFQDANIFRYYAIVYLKSTPVSGELKCYQITPGTSDSLTILGIQMKYRRLVQRDLW